MMTTVCDAVWWAGISAATLSSTTEGSLDLFMGAGWLSTAVTEAMESVAFEVPVLLG